MAGKMPGTPAKREPHEGSAYPSQIVGERAAELRSLRRISQEEIANRMADLGHSWVRQTVSQIERGKRNVTIDELVGLAAALQTTVAYLLSPKPLGSYEWGLWTGQVDVGGPHALVRPAIIGLYGFEPARNPTAEWQYLWPDLTRFTNVAYLLHQIERLREEGRLSDPLTVETVRRALVEKYLEDNPEADPDQYDEFLGEAIDDELLKRLRKEGNE